MHKPPVQTHREKQQQPPQQQPRLGDNVLHTYATHPERTHCVCLNA
jgi:hypothetical protein